MDMEAYKRMEEAKAANWCRRKDGSSLGAKKGKEEFQVTREKREDGGKEIHKTGQRENYNS